MAAAPTDSQVSAYCMPTLAQFVMCVLTCFTVSSRLVSCRVVSCAEESLELGDASLHSQSHLKINAQPNSLKFQMASFEYRSQLLLENDEAIRANGFFQKSVKEHTLGGTICAFCYNTTLPWNVENADTQVRKSKTCLI